MAFLDLVDRSGRLQLQAKLDVLGDERMERLLGLDLGDLIGVDGVAFRSKRGELSLRVEDFAVLAKSRWLVWISCWVSTIWARMLVSESASGFSLLVSSEVVSRLRS